VKIVKENLPGFQMQQISADSHSTTCDDEDIFANVLEQIKVGCQKS
jgi:hypothetical protein